MEEWGVIASFAEQCKVNCSKSGVKIVFQRRGRNKNKEKQRGVGERCEVWRQLLSESVGESK